MINKVGTIKPLTVTINFMASSDNDKCQTLLDLIGIIMIARDINVEAGHFNLCESKGILWRR